MNGQFIVKIKIHSQFRRYLIIIPFMSQHLVLNHKSNQTLVSYVYPTTRHPFFKSLFQSRSWHAIFQAIDVVMGVKGRKHIKDVINNAKEEILSRLVTMKSCILALSLPRFDKVQLRHNYSCYIFNCHRKHNF